MIPQLVRVTDIDGNPAMLNPRRISSITRFRGEPGNACVMTKEGTYIVLEMDVDAAYIHIGGLMAEKEASCQAE